MLSRPERRRATRLDKLYATMPVLECQGLCHESCGPIAMTRVEWARIIDLLGFEPEGESPKLRCPMLDADDCCTVYEIRPTICRLWGLTEPMPCTFGCKPNRMLTREQGYSLLRKAESIGR